ncbi:C-type lectin domain family 2 member F-like [Octodon degus]|uniref:C-type lectin domain family 2 member F-like n=1 Tax=Octodon degus TaxID=10160 RepID=A0A6P6DYS8_OCTDE|nr:C-type lectin domain family 2 member F-like [Octodon degus]
MEGELENRRRREKVRRKMIIFTIFLCGVLAVLLWLMLKFPKKVAIKKANMNCTDDMRICPQDWDLIRMSCFFESKQDVTWIQGQEHCRKYHATLAKIVSQIEMDSIKSFLENSTYWIGLRKHTSDNAWRWMDGSHFNNWSPISGSGTCAFVSANGLDISRCDETRRYLCIRKSYCA